MNQKVLTRSEGLIRMACIVGACICFVIGLRFIYEGIAYDFTWDPFYVMFVLVPFIPIVLMAPRHQRGASFYFSVGLGEVSIIVMNHFLVVR